MSDKKGLLPIVTESTGFAVQAELEQTERNNYVSALLVRLKEDNPQVANFIANFSNTQENPIGIAYSALLTYRLLESAAEAEKLSKEFKL